MDDGGGGGGPPSLSKNAYRYRRRWRRRRRSVPRAPCWFPLPKGPFSRFAAWKYAADRASFEFRARRTPVTDLARFAGRLVALVGRACGARGGVCGKGLLFVMISTRAPTRPFNCLRARVVCRLAFCFCPKYHHPRDISLRLSSEFQTKTRLGRRTPGWQFNRLIIGPSFGSRIGLSCGPSVKLKTSCLQSLYYKLRE